MKKKLINKVALALCLCAVLVGLVPVQSAKAGSDNDYYDVESGYVLFNGFSCYAGDTAKGLIDSGCEYLLVHDSNGTGLVLVVFDEGLELACWQSGNTFYQILSGGVPSTVKPSVNKRFRFDISDTAITLRTAEGETAFSTQSTYKDEFGNYPVQFVGRYANILACSANVISCNYDSKNKTITMTEEIYYISDVGKELQYSFYRWCNDAILSIGASSLTDTSLFPAFNYHPSYMYIVTRIDGGYHLVQIYTNDELNQFTGLASYDNKLYISVREAMETLVNVRHFYYKQDGWLGYFSKTHEIKANDCLIDLGVEISEENKLVYTSSPIKTGWPMGEVYYKSDEYDSLGYAGASAPVQNPYLTPIPTPTLVPPSGGGGSLGGGSVVNMYNPPYLGSVSASYASIYNVVAGSDDDILVDILHGMQVDVLGFTKDGVGSLWYYCVYTNSVNNVSYSGFIDGKSLELIGVNVDVEDLPIVDAGTFGDAVRSIADMVKMVPSFISEMLSFMPRWAVSLLAVGLGLLAILIPLRLVL